MTPRALALAIVVLLPAAAWAEGACRTGLDRDDNPATLTVRSDNDLYGRAKQDQGYTNGVAITFVSPNLAEPGQDPCLPAPVRWLNRYLDWRQPGGFEQQNMVLGITHGIYTPTDGTRGDLIADDRPYAGVATLSLGYSARTGNRLRTSHFRLGVVGPSAWGEGGQDTLHRLFGRERFRGWDHQLRDEVVVQLVHERLWRHRPETSAHGWGWDAIGHVGGSLGNLATYANAGGEVRWGRWLPDDFGSDPMRPAGENRAPSAGRLDASQWAGHLFVGLDARAVAHDITLDGNTWKDSHSVDSRKAVADLSLGIAFTRGPWKIAGSHVRRTREFHGQVERPVFGSISLSRAF
ncbi:MAG: lipid A deacylase LpxR family protein [Arenimonas sp.]|uniref:lipid A deacylase LpxR family protein n=1 Tax=Arenimonas sp. TaxID=1872635 RepID=UPI0025B9AC5B|nr:lipid A deacylase LpxR family protein [Arenimonas sp.]MBW8367560.1 lipid A deacylase LpxR family protein [Arenimonas sp.]